MISVQIDPDFENELDTEILRLAAQTTLDHLDTAGAELTIVLRDDSELQRLNREYRGLDETTDVLSFPSGEAGPHSGPGYLGDVVLSAPQAKRQAIQAGHEYIEELQLLVVHGVLHLLGYDHSNNDQKTRMWKVQDAILDSLGVRVRPN